MEGNNIITRDYLIPDMDDKSGYTKYSVSLFKTVPKNTVLVCKNKFTGSVTKKGTGLRFNLPWVASKFVSTATKTIDYPKEVYKTQDGIEVTIDLALTVKVVYPVVYETGSQNPLQELGILAKDLMRTYVASMNAEDLYKTTFNLTAIDKKDRFKNLAKSTGVEVKRVYVKNIELPQSMKDDFEKQVAAEKEHKIAKVKADTAMIEAQTQADKLDVQIKAFIKNGFTKEQIIKYLIEHGFANGNAQVIANLNGNTNSSSLGAAQMVVNGINNGNNQTKTKTR